MKPAPDTLVLIGFAEALAAPECLWSLVDAGYSVAAFTRQGSMTALSHSRHVRLHAIPAPEARGIDAQRSLQALLDALAAQNSGRRLVLMPLDDAAVWLCGQASLGAWRLAGPATEAAVRAALDKHRQCELAQSVGLAPPATTLLRDVADLARIAPRFPIILRSADAVRLHASRLHKGRNWICGSAAELDAARAAWSGRGDLLLQPYVQGVGEGVFGLRTDQGVVVAWSAHRRLRMMNPQGSGSSACESRSVDAALRVPISRFLAAIDWQGLFMFEFLRDAQGVARFVEFNGRAWGSMALARRQGYEYPAWSVRLALREAAPLAEATAPREGLVCRNLGRELLHLLFVLRGRRSQAVAGWPTFLRALRDVMRPYPDSSFYNWRRGEWRVFASDCCYTIARQLRRRSHEPTA